MNDEFDKEAEREKLREKYERDKEKRETTEQMSELLLQGATMTNAHCSACSDPIFRYEGQEFCPTCEKPVDRGDGEESADEDGDDGDIQVTTPSDDARVTFGKDGQQTDAEQGAETEPATGEEETGGQQPEQATVRQQANEQRQPATEGSPDRSQERPRMARRRQPPQTSSVSEGTDGQGEASTATAREALVQTLTHFSQQAAATDDPARAQEHLAAAREAAEALDALRR